MVPETWTGKERIGLYSYDCCSCCLGFGADVMLRDIVMLLRSVLSFARVLKRQLGGETQILAFT